MKRNVLSLVCLLVLGAVAWFVFKGKGEAEDATEEAPATFPLDVSQIDRLEILRHEGSGSTLREEAIVIAKKGELWLIEAPVAYKAHQQLIELMLEAMEGIKIIDSITDNPDKHRALEVDNDFGVVVKATASGSEMAHFIVGVTQGEITFIRFPGSDTVYRTTGAYRKRFNKSTSKLRDKAVLAIDNRSVSKMKFVNSKGTLEMERTSEGDDSTFASVGMEIQNFNGKRALASADALPLLITRDFVDRDPGDAVTGLGEGADTVEFDAKVGGENKTMTLWVGKEIEKMRKTHLRTSESDQIYLVSSHLIGRYRLGPDDFARTDEQVKEQIEAEKKSREHAEQHHHGGHSHGQDHGHDHGNDDGHDHSGHKH